MNKKVKKSVKVSGKSVSKKSNITNKVKTNRKKISDGKLIGEEKKSINRDNIKLKNNQELPDPFVIKETNYKDNLTLIKNKSFAEKKAEAEIDVIIKTSEGFGTDVNNVKNESNRPITSEIGKYNDFRKNLGLDNSKYPDIDNSGYPVNTACEDIEEMFLNPLQEEARNEYFQTLINIIKSNNYLPETDKFLIMSVVESLKRIIEEDYKKITRYNKMIRDIMEIINKNKDTNIESEIKLLSSLWN